MSSGVGRGRPDRWRGCWAERCSQGAVLGLIVSSRVSFFPRKLLRFTLFHGRREIRHPPPRRLPLWREHGPELPRQSPGPGGSRWAGHMGGVARLPATSGHQVSSPWDRGAVQMHAGGLGQGQVPGDRAFIPEPGTSSLWISSRAPQVTDFKERKGPHIPWTSGERRDPNRNAEKWPAPVLQVCPHESPEK